jgi:hypothetical protein
MFDRDVSQLIASRPLVSLQEPPDRRRMAYRKGRLFAADDCRAQMHSLDPEKRLPVDACASRAHKSYKQKFF